MDVLDLCAGIGGFSQAFRDKGHNVTTLDTIEPADIIADVRNYSTNDPYDLVLASPPCTEFSKANWRLGPCKQRNPDLSVVNGCLRIIEEIQPTYWVLENPRACLRYFIGPPQCTVNYSDYGHVTKKPTDLWGFFPIFLGYSPNDNIELWSHSHRDPRKRACVPYGLSLALCRAISQGTQDKPQG